MGGGGPCHQDLLFYWTQWSIDLDDPTTFNELIRSKKGGRALPSRSFDLLNSMICWFKMNDWTSLDDIIISEMITKLKRSYTYFELTHKADHILLGKFSEFWYQASGEPYSQKVAPTDWGGHSCWLKLFSFSVTIFGASTRLCLRHSPLNIQALHLLESLCPCPCWPKTI